MASIQKLSEGLFCIQWNIPSDYSDIDIPISNQTQVVLKDIFESCDLNEVHNITANTPWGYQYYCDTQEVTLEMRIVFTQLKSNDLEKIKILASKGSGLQQMKLNEVKSSNVTINLPNLNKIRKQKTPQGTVAGAPSETEISVNKPAVSKWSTTFLPSASKCCGQEGLNFEILIDLTDCSAFASTKQSKYVLEHLSNLWTNKTLADVTFKCKERTIKAHTLIVASGSPVMAAMFQNNFKENRERVVEINEIAANVFEDLLRYIYTGETDFRNMEVDKLLVAADMYGIDSLKEECASHLSKNLTIENVLGILVLAHLHNSQGLYEAALNFMSKNAKAVCSRKDWMVVIKKYPELSFAAMQLMVLG